MKKALFQGILIAGVFGISLEALGAVAGGAGGGVADDGPTAASAVKIRLACCRIKHISFN